MWKTGSASILPSLAQPGFEKMTARYLPRVLAAKQPIADFIDGAMRRTCYFSGFWSYLSENIATASAGSASHVFTDLTR